MSPKLPELRQRGKLALLEEHQAVLYTMLCEFDRVCEVIHTPYFLFAGTLLGAIKYKGFIPWDDDVDVIMLREDYDRFLREAPALVNSGYFVQQEFSEHWPMFFSKLRLNETACLEKYHPKDSKSHQGVYIDIFPCDNAFQSEFGRKAQFLCSKIVIAKGLYQRGYDTENRIKKLFMVLCRMLPKSPFLRIVKGPRKKSSYVHSFLGAASKYKKNVYERNWFEQSELRPFESNVFSVPVQYDPLLRKLYGDYMQPPPEGEEKCKRHAILVDLKKSYECYEKYRDGMTFDILTRSIR